MKRILIEKILCYKICAAATLELHFNEPIKIKMISELMPNHSFPKEIS